MTTQQPPSGFDVERVRKDFPMLRKQLDGRPLVYLDSAASTQKPQAVIDRLARFYTEEFAKNAEEHRLSQAATEQIERTRKLTAKLLNAPDAAEIAFLRNATEGLHVVADGLAASLLQDGDEIVLTELEHHSNIVPWLVACQRTGARLKVAPITEAGDVDLEALGAMLSARTRVVAVSHVSHVLGTVVPVARIAEMARRVGAITVVDGAQATPHVPIDVQEIGCAFYVGCGHKTYGPTSVGILYGTREWLDRIPPQGGGSDNAESVSFQDWSPKPPPDKFQAGTPPIADIVAFGTSLDYIEAIGLESIMAYEEELDMLLSDRLSAIPRIRVLGEPKEKVALTSFVIDGVEDAKAVSTFLDKHHAIALRAGPLSAQPLMQRLGVKGAVRASLALYSTRQEIEALVDGLSDFIRTR